jgi:phosphatidylglycerol---prolipoprotein diacylglyceryl transferase
MTEAGPLIIDIDPNLIKIGPLAIRWYALAYIAGLVLGWQYIRYLLKLDRMWATRNAADFPRERRRWFWKKLPFLRLGWERMRWDAKTRSTYKVTPPARPEDIDDLLVWATLGVIVGGRLGYVLIYGMLYCGFAGPEITACYTTPTGESWASYYLSHPLEILMIWKGGMAFHGGLLGVVLAVILFARARGLDMVRIGDLVALGTPIGLFFGRIANFINGELWGKATDAPWGMVFARELRERGMTPDMLNREELMAFVRHPSQLYEAFLEGLVLFLILHYLARYRGLLNRPGLAIAIFLFGYGIARAVSEVYRDSEARIFAEGSGITMGMLLSLPMWAAGAFFLWYALSPSMAGRRGAKAATAAPQSAGLDAKPAKAAKKETARDSGKPAVEDGEPSTS